MHQNTKSKSTRCNKKLNPFLKKFRFLLDSKIVPIVAANKSSCKLWDGVSTVNKYQFIKLVHGLPKLDSLKDLNLCIQIVKNN